MAKHQFEPTTENTVSESQSFDAKQLKTGLSELTKELQGGIPAGSIIGVPYPADSAGELLGYKLASAKDRPTLYLSTVRSAKQTFQSIKQTQTGLDTSGTESLSVAALHPNNPLGTEGTANTDSNIRNNPDGTLSDGINHLHKMEQPTLILDSTTDCIGAESDEWWSVFQDLADCITETGGVAFLFFHTPSSPEGTDTERRLCRIVDGIFRYQPTESERGGDTLRITKLREIDEQATNLPIEFELDVSRNISVSREETFE